MLCQLQLKNSGVAWYIPFSGLLMFCLDESTPIKVVHIPGGFPPTFDALKA
jgi:hypothetical protein